MDDETRIARQRAFARKRDEKGRTDLLRGRTDLLRGRTDLLRGRTDLLRGRTDLTRGRTDLLRGAGHAAATDIFRQAVGLGGHLIVKFVAPVSASPGQPGFHPAAALSRADRLSADADAELAAAGMSGTPIRKVTAK